MSSLLNPLHPATIFLVNKKGRQYSYMNQVILPPGSQLTMTIAPSVDLVWVMVVDTNSPPRDNATGNPLVTALFYIDVEHSMLSTTRLFGFESYYNFPWATNLHVSTGEPVTYTFVNNTAVTIRYNFTIGILEIPVRYFQEYMELWNGIENIWNIMSEYTPEDIKAFSNALKQPPPIPTEEEE